MSPPYLIETPYRVILEFKKSNTGVVKRTIELAYTPLEVPAQLQGRIPIEVRRASVSINLEGNMKTKAHMH